MKYDFLTYIIKVPLVVTVYKILAGMAQGIEIWSGKYSRVPNKRTGRSLENEKKSHLYALIWDYSFINFHKKVPPIRLFPPILLFIFELSHPFFMLISLFSLWTYYVITMQKF